jgi:hypothetical protein
MLALQAGVQCPCQSEVVAHGRRRRTGQGGDLPPAQAPPVHKHPLLVRSAAPRSSRARSILTKPAESGIFERPLHSRHAGCYVVYWLSVSGNSRSVAATALTAAGSSVHGRPVRVQA